MKMVCILKPQYFVIKQEGPGKANASNLVSLQLAGRKRSVENQSDCRLCSDIKQHDVL
jgi:hypothetical protein